MARCPSQTLSLADFLGDRFSVCLSVLSYPCMCVLFVTLEHCGQTVGRIKMLLGMEVGLGPGDIVLDRDPATPTERATTTPK